MKWHLSRQVLEVAAIVVAAAVIGGVEVYGFLVLEPKTGPESLNGWFSDV